MDTLRAGSPRYFVHWVPRQNYFSAPKRAAKATVVGKAETASSACDLAVLVDQEIAAEAYYSTLVVVYPVGHTPDLMDQNFQSVVVGIPPVVQDTAQVGVGKVASAVNSVVPHQDLAPCLYRNRSVVMVVLVGHILQDQEALVSDLASLVQLPRCRFRYRHPTDYLMAEGA